MATFTLRPLVLACSIAMLAACGSDGSDGTNGTNGQNGADGANGADGNNARNGHLVQIGRYQSGIFDDGGAEIVAFDATSDQLFVVNAGDNTVDVLDISNPANPTKVSTLDLSAEDDTDFTAGGANSVAVANGLLAVAIEADTKQDAGRVYFYNTSDLSFAGSADAGALPDMVTFTHDGNTVLVANEGEPSNDYSVDPEGSITLVDLSQGIANATSTQVTFTAFNSQAADLKSDGVRLFGPGASVAQDLEPEYIAVSADDSQAFITLQENNALAILDIASASITDIVPLGYKDHSLQGNGLDADKNDKYPQLATLPVYGMYQPDAIAAYSFNGNTYLITANEGDAREYIYDTDATSCTNAGHTDLGDGECLAFGDETALKDLNLNTSVFTADQIAMLQDGGGIGDLVVSRVDGDDDGNGQYGAIYAYGARSFSIWNASGERVFDSGDQLEQIVADQSPLFFNLSNDKNSTDNRSDNKGPEPEGVAIGQVADRTYAFIGLERQGGIMVFDVTNPFSPFFVEYQSNRDLAVEPDEGVDAGDLGPEGLVFISAEDSPTGVALVVVGNEVSGTTTIYQVQ